MPSIRDEMCKWPSIIKEQASVFSSLFKKVLISFSSKLKPEEERTNKDYLETPISTTN